MTSIFTHKKKIQQIMCSSCSLSYPENEIKYTNRAGEKLPLCQFCWDSAVVVLDLLRPSNYADAARQRYLDKNKTG